MSDALYRLEMLYWLLGANPNWSRFVDLQTDSYVNKNYTADDICLKCVNTCVNTLL